MLFLACLLVVLAQQSLRFGAGLPIRGSSFVRCDWIAKLGGQASFDFASTYIPNIDPSTLDKQVELPFGTFSKRQILLIIYEHSGEH